MRSVLLISLLVLAGFAANSSAREVKKWVDENGQVNYGDYAESRKSKSVNVPDSNSRSSAPASSSSRLETRQKLLDSMTEDRKKKQEASAKAKKDLALAKKNCSTAKSNLNTLSAGGRIVRYDAEGKPQYMDDNQRKSEIAEAQKHVDKWCK